MMLHKFRETNAKSSWVLQDAVRCTKLYFLCFSTDGGLSTCSEKTEHRKP